MQQLMSIKVPLSQNDKITKNGCLGLAFTEARKVNTNVNSKNIKDKQQIKIIGLDKNTNAINTIIAHRNGAKPNAYIPTEQRPNYLKGFIPSHIDLLNVEILDTFYDTVSIGSKITKLKSKPFDSKDPKFQQIINTLYTYVCSEIELLPINLEFRKATIALSGVKSFKDKKDLYPLVSKEASQQMENGNFDNLEFEHLFPIDGFIKFLLKNFEHFLTYELMADFFNRFYICILVTREEHLRVKKSSLPEDQDFETKDLYYNTLAKMVLRYIDGNNINIICKDDEYNNEVIELLIKVHN